LRRHERVVLSILFFLSLASDAHAQCGLIRTGPMLVSITFVLVTVLAVNRLLRRRVSQSARIIVSVSLAPVFLLGAVFLASYFSLHY